LIVAYLFALKIAHAHRLAARRLDLDLGEQRFGLLHLDRSDIGVRRVIDISAEIVPLELRLEPNAKPREVRFELLLDHFLDHLSQLRVRLPPLVYWALNQRQYSL
jgi:hypothetical protein